MLIGLLVSLLLFPLIVTPVSASGYYYANAWWDNDKNWNFQACGVKADIQLHAGYIGWGYPAHHIASYVSIWFPETENGKNWIEIGWTKVWEIFQKVVLFVGLMEDGEFDIDRMQKLAQDSTHNYQIAVSGWFAYWFVCFDSRVIKEFYLPWTGGVIGGAGEHYGDKEGKYRSHFSDVSYYRYLQPFKLWDKIDTYMNYPYKLIVNNTHDFIAKHKDL